jgi:hypothetical protein
MKATTKRFVSALLAMCFFVAAFVVFFDFVQPAYNALMTAKGKLAGERQLLQNESTTIAQVKSVMSAYAGQNDAARSIGQILPLGENIAGAAAQIYGLASADNIAIQAMSLSFSAPAQGTARVVSVSGTGSDTGFTSGVAMRPTGTIAFSVTANGNYESFKNFLSGLETNMRIFDVKQLSIQPSAGSGSQKTANSFTYLLTVNTYYQTN